MKAILAGNSQEFRYYYDRKLIPQEWVDGLETRNLIGIHLDDYEILGTFWDRDDAHEKLWAVRTRLKTPK